MGEHVRTPYLPLALTQALPLALTSREVIWWASTCAASSMIRSICSGTWGDTGEMQGRCRGDTGEIQGRCVVDDQVDLLGHLSWGKG